MLVLAIAMIFGFVMLPLSQSVSADDADVVVESFESGMLASAIEEAKDGTDLNLIKRIAVLDGTLNAEDYQALCGYPNVDYIELAGCETENGIIPENALSSRNQLTYVSLPSNTVTIGARAFSNNKKLVKISIPSSLRNVGDSAFEGCEALESVSLPAALETIGTGAFKDCKSITELAVPAAITEIPPECFQKCGITELHLGPQITKIGDSAFADCYSLTDVYYYGRTPLSMNEGCFQNVKLTLHTYESNEGFDGLNSNFVTVAYDMDDSSEYIAPSDSSATDASDTPKASDALEPHDVISSPEAPEAIVSPLPDSPEAPNPPESPDRAIQTSAGASGQFSTVSVIIICVLVAALAVTVTLLVVKKK